MESKSDRERERESNELIGEYLREIPNDCEMNCMLIVKSEENLNDTFDYIRIIMIVATVVILAECEKSMEITIRSIFTTTNTARNQTTTD